MPLIEIPDAYWTITPRGFSELTGSVQPAVEALFVQVGNTAIDLQIDRDANTEPALNDIDGDSFALDEATAQELGLAASVPTEDVLKQYPSADAAHQHGDTAVAPVNAVQG